MDLATSIRQTDVSRLKRAIDSILYSFDAEAEQLRAAIQRELRSRQHRHWFSNEPTCRYCGIAR